jgi:putative oxidoreductase
MLADSPRINPFCPFPLSLSRPLAAPLRTLHIDDGGDGRQGGRMRVLARGVLWLFQVVLAAMFLGAGVAKFSAPAWARMFARWGYPDYFYLVIGILEVAAGIALLVPRTAAPAALLLIVIMIGAGLTHALHGELHRLPQIVIMTTLLGVVAYARWSDAIRRKISG